VRTLNDAYRRSLAVGVAFENKNGLGKRAGDYDFVVNAIVGEAMHRPADQCLLTFERSDRW